jgi:hypothetical protein
VSLTRPMKVASNAIELESEMSTNEIALNELEWRSAQITASAGEAFSKVLRQPVSAVRHYRVLKSISGAIQAINEFLALIHTTDSITALESATPEQRSDLGRQLDEAYSKLHLLIARTETLSRTGSWKHFYAPRLEKICDCNRQLKAHANALRDSDTSLLLLTKRDQEFLLEALLNPGEPAEEQRQAFTRK